MTNDVATKIELARLDERLKSLQREIARMEESNSRAIEIAAQELSRRLENLNHAHTQAVEVQATYLPRETFDGFKGSNDERMNKLENFNANLMGKTWIGGAVVLVLAAALAIFIPMIKGG